MDSSKMEDVAVITDDAARFAETQSLAERMPRYDTNGLNPCDKMTFSPQHKLRALTLAQWR